MRQKGKKQETRLYIIPLCSTHPLASKTLFSDLLTTQTHTIHRGVLRFATQISPLLNCYLELKYLFWIGVKNISLENFTCLLQVLAKK